MKRRIFIDVLAHFRGGRVRPVSLTLEDGRRFAIDRVTDVRRAPSKSGGAGLRYTCVIMEREIPLYFDEWENVWWYDG
ncbi:MAG: hypothetical protein GX777_08080 [Fastidiosipila sp.]|nr:hypothetical protein [Fastidiosipila sp.]